MKQSIPQERDGFHVREGEFPLPTDTSNLDPKSKRAVTICNLFINHHHSISDIVRVLDENHSNVVRELLKKGLIRDRRMRKAAPPQGGERRAIVVSLNGTPKTPMKILLNYGTESQD